MGKSPPLFRSAVGAAGVALFVLLAFLLFGTPDSPLSAPAAPTFTPPRPSVVPTVIRQTITPTLATIAITATAIVTPTSVATKPTPTATPTFVATLVPTSTLPITAGWKIYENGEHGFRIRHTPVFTYVIIQGWTGTSGSELLFEMYFYDGAKYQASVSQEFPKIGLQIISNPQRLTIDAWAKAHLYTASGAGKNTFQFLSYEYVRTMNIAGVPASRLDVTSPYGNVVHQILVPHPREARIISLYYQIDPPSIEPLFELTASTLELTR